MLAILETVVGLKHGLTGLDYITVINSVLYPNINLLNSLLYPVASLRRAGRQAAPGDAIQGVTL